MGLLQATALGTYIDNDFVDCPFLVERKRGNGTALYCGGFPEDELLEKLMTYALETAAVKSGPAIPPWVEVLRRGDMTFIINHRNEPVTVDIQAEKTLVGECRDGKVCLAPYGVCILPGSSC